MKLVTTLLFCLCIISSYGQGKAIKKAISKGSDGNDIYLASFNKPINEDKIMQWFAGTDYRAISVLEGKIARFGSYQHGIVGVRFMNNEVYARHIAAEAARRQRALASAQSRNRSSSSNSSFVEDYGGAIIGTALFAAAAYGAYKLVTSGGSGGANSSSRSYSNYTNRKLSCKVDFDEFELDFISWHGVKNSEATVYCDGEIKYSISVAYDSDSNLPFKMYSAMGLSTTSYKSFAELQEGLKEKYCDCY